jgi:hypothetical protein
MPARGRGADERHGEVAVSSLYSLAYQYCDIPPAWISMLAEYHKPTYGIPRPWYSMRGLLLTVMLVCGLQMMTSAKTRRLPTFLP